MWGNCHTLGNPDSLPGHEGPQDVARHPGLENGWLGYVHRKPYSRGHSVHSIHGHKCLQGTGATKLCVRPFHISFCPANMRTQIFNIINIFRHCHAPLLLSLIS